MREEKSNEKYDCYWCNQENNFCVEIKDNIVMICLLYTSDAADE